MKEKFIEECKIIQQNCTYTAETHHQMASQRRRLTYSVQLVPAVIAAISSSLGNLGTLNAILPPNYLPLLPLLTLVSSITVAVSTVMDPNKSYQENINAAKN